MLVLSSGQEVILIFILKKTGGYTITVIGWGCEKEAGGIVGQVEGGPQGHEGEPGFGSQEAPFLESPAATFKRCS